MERYCSPFPSIWAVKHSSLNFTHYTENYRIFKLIHWSVESRGRNWQGETVMMLKPEQALEEMLTRHEQLPPETTDPKNVLHLYNKGNNGTDDTPRNCNLKNIWPLVQEASFLWRLLMHAISIRTTYHSQRKEKIPIFHKNHYLQGKKTQSKIDSKYRKIS